MAEDERRRFEDEDDHAWEVHAQEDFKWQFVRAEGDERRIVTPPPEADDPHELSDEEMRTLLESGIPAAGITEPLEPGAS